MRGSGGSGGNGGNGGNGVCSWRGWIRRCLVADWARPARWERPVSGKRGAAGASGATGVGGSSGAAGTGGAVGPGAASELVARAVLERHRRSVGKRWCDGDRRFPVHTFELRSHCTPSDGFRWLERQPRLRHFDVRFDFSRLR